MQPQAVWLRLGEFIRRQENLITFLLAQEQAGPFFRKLGLQTIEGLGRLHTQVTLVACLVGSIPTSRLPTLNVHNFSDDRQQPSHQSVHAFY